MKLRCTGRTIKEVSGILAICVKTVNNHITAVYEKLGTNILVRITGYALDHDIVKPWELWNREDVTRGGR
jgi:DNA-binding NarL/FixJ family response regulator